MYVIWKSVSEICCVRKNKERLLRNEKKGKTGDRFCAVQSVPFLCGVLQSEHIFVKTKENGNPGKI
jgi:hypothetical protein